MQPVRNRKETPWVAATLAVLICAQFAFAQQFDFLIRNGHIIDGTGSP